MTDPLAGSRESLNSGAPVLTFPDSPTCPVEQGQAFKLRSCVVEIGSTRRKLINGEWLWHVKVTRKAPDIARIPAKQNGHEHPEQYVSTSSQAIKGAGEEVPPSYQDSLTREARLRAAESQSEAKSERDRGSGLQIAIRRLRSLEREAQRHGVDVLPHLARTIRDLQDEIRERRAA